MRKAFVLLMMVLLALGLAACGGGDAENAPAESSAVSTETEDAAASTQESTKSLVVYFSATGTTKGVAEKIAALEGADLYEIKAAQEYTDADLDWNDSDSRTTQEQNDSSVRPEIVSEKLSLDGYTTIYIGYPIWWGEEPRIMDTFVESYDFDGITMIPFCTSGGSGISGSMKHIRNLAAGADVKDGIDLTDASAEEIRDWIGAQ